MTKHYHIHSSAGIHMGIFAGATAEDAVRAMMADGRREYGSESAGTVDDYDVDPIDILYRAGEGTLGLWHEYRGDADDQTLQQLVETESEGGARWCLVYKATGETDRDGNPTYGEYDPYTGSWRSNKRAIPAREITPYRPI